MALKIFEQQLQMCCMLNKNIFWKNYKTSKIWDTMCPNFGSAFWDFHATFVDKSKVYYREDNGGYSQGWVV